MEITAKGVVHGQNPIRRNLRGKVHHLMTIIGLTHKIPDSPSASLTAFYIPFMAVAVGVGLLNEAFSSTALIGLLTTLCGTLLVLRNRRRD